MELLKLLNANEVVAQIINFLLLLFLLRVFLWKRVLKFLDERKAKIASEFEYIDKTKGDVEKLKSDFKDKLGEIEDIAKVRIQQAQKEGRAQAEQIKETAHEDAMQIIQAAKSQIKYEIDKAKEKLKEEIIDITIRAAEDVLGEKLTDKRDRNLVENFLNQIDKAA